MKIHEPSKVKKNIKGMSAHIQGDMGSFSLLYSKEVEIGKGVHISAGVKIVGRGKLIIGDFVTIAPNVVIYTSRPDLDEGAGNKYSNTHKRLEGEVILGDHCFIGANSTIGVNTEIGSYAIVGANTYVENKTIMAGFKYYNGGYQGTRKWTG